MPNNNAMLYYVVTHCTDCHAKQSLTQKYEARAERRGAQRHIKILPRGGARPSVEAHHSQSMSCLPVQCQQWTQHQPALGEKTESALKGEKTESAPEVDGSLAPAHICSQNDTPRFVRVRRLGPGLVSRRCGWQMRHIAGKRR